jgi:hypothetical protein
MASKNVQANIEILMSNGKKAGLTLNELRQAANHLTKEINNLKPGTEEYIKATKKLKVVNKNLGEVRSEVKGLTTATSGMVQEFTRFIPFSGQIGNFSRAFTTLRGAMIAIPIFALVAAFGALFQWFTRTEEGAQKLRVITAAVSQVFNSLMDVVSGAGKELFEMFSNPKEAVKDLWESIKTNLLNRLTGLIDTYKFAGKAIMAALNLDWDGVKENAAAAGESILQATTGIDDLPNKVKESVDSAGDAIKDLYAEVKSDVAGAVALQERENALKVQKREFLLREVQLEDQIAEARKRGNDQQLSDIERAEALEEAMQVQNKLADERMAIAQEEYEIQKERNALSDSTEADLEKEAQLEQAVLRIKVQSANEQRRIISMLSGLKEKAAAEEIRNAKAIEDLKIEAMEEGLQKQIAKIELDTERKIEALTGSEEQIREQEKLLEEIKLQEIQALRDKYANEQAEKDKKIREEKEDAEKKHVEVLKEIENQRFEAAQSSTSGIINLLEEEAKSEQAGRMLKKSGAIADLIFSFVRERAAISAKAAEIALTAPGPVGLALAAKYKIGATIQSVVQHGLRLAAVRKLEKGGMLRGKRHFSGGIPGLIMGTGEPIEMEDGEIILNRNVGLDPRGRAAASALNAAFGGKRFETGGVINPLAAQTEPSAAAQMLPSANNKELAEKFEAFANEIRAWKRSLKVYNVVTETEEGIKTVQALRDSVDV